MTISIALGIRTILLILAIIAFVLAALGVPRAQWIAVGLALMAASFIFG